MHGPALVALQNDGVVVLTRIGVSAVGTSADARKWHHNGVVVLTRDGVSVVVADGSPHQRNSVGVVAVDTLYPGVLIEVSVVHSYR